MRVTLLHIGEEIGLRHQVTVLGSFQNRMQLLRRQSARRVLREIARDPAELRRLRFGQYLALDRLPVHINNLSHGQFPQ
ncbi:hypothetical protein [Burkholderia pseudomallei]